MKEEFAQWMKAQGRDEKTISTQLSQARRLERAFDDLDEAFEADRFERISASLAYSKEDERAGKPNPAPFTIEGNLYRNLAGYRTTLNYYAEFRRALDNEQASVSIKLNAEELAEMRRIFLAQFPDFESLGFQATEGGYWEQERHYKQRLIDRAAKIMAEEATAFRKGEALLALLGPDHSNLLDWREVQRLRKTSDRESLIGEAAGMLVLSTVDPSRAVEAFVQLVWPSYLAHNPDIQPFADMRVIPTILLALVRPRQAIAVRFMPFQTAARRLLDIQLFRNAPLSGEEYQRTLDMAWALFEVLREWGWAPRDLWDVQGFLWVAHYRRAVEKDEDRDEPGSGEAQDRYPTLADDPARVDALERQPFAAVLAARIREIRNSQRGRGPDEDRAFMVHLHGPWGSGKSSTLNFIQEELEDPQDGSAPWLVIWFNAWKNQRMRPPWWALLSAAYHGAVRNSGDRPRRPIAERLAVRWLWFLWQIQAQWLPLLLVMLIVAGLAFAIVGGVVPNAGDLLKFGVPAAAAVAAFYGYAQLMVFGSQKAIQAYADLTTDPYRRVVQLFNRLVHKIGSPLIIFVDDLDRCDSDYVVELLEGIQTLFRHAPVTYVVAADRKWICSSFEKKYGDFTDSIGESCRPLGYLFLDKMFQISAGMPRLTPELQASYLGALLGDEQSASKPESSVAMAASQRVRGMDNEEELQRTIDRASGEAPEVQRALRAAAALQITSGVALRETEHRLQKFAHLLEPNPRSMKRLVNAVAMAQARSILEGRTASPETRARWAMLSLRWPILADFIADHPQAIDHWANSEGKTEYRPELAWPGTVQGLLGNTAVKAVVGGAGDEGALTQESLASLLA